MKRAAVALSVSILTLALPSIAFADDNEKEPHADPQPVAGGTVPEANPPMLDKPNDGTVAKPAEEDRWRATVDVVFGFGATPIITQQVVGPLLTQESRTAQTSRFTTQSFNLGLNYELFRNFEVGALLPLGTGNIYPDQNTRGQTVVGNFTLGVDYKMHPRQDLAVNAGLDVALPTASGDELPDASTLGTSGHLNQTDLDRFSLLRAMSNSRGREDTASFSTNHLGLVPKVGVLYTGSEKIVVEGYVKYESLHATNDDTKYEGAVVIAGRLSYHLTNKIDATLRVWTNIAVAGPDSAVAAAEPQFSAHIGWIEPVIGVVLPFAGEITNPYTVGVRAALLARF